MAKRLDLTGKVFHNLTAIKPGKDILNKCGTMQTTWVCLCECGRKKCKNRTTVRTGDLNKGATKSCGCSKGYTEHDIEYLVGKKYNKLTILGLGKTNVSKYGNIYATLLCLCECGRETTVNIGSIFKNDKSTKSCGKCIWIISRYKDDIEKLNGKFGIYEIVNPITNRTYIGSGDLEIRLKDHCRELEGTVKRALCKEIKEDWKKHDHDESRWIFKLVKEFPATPEGKRDAIVAETKLIYDRYIKQLPIYNKTIIQHIPKLSTEYLEKFWDKVEKGKPDECWLWKGNSNEFGYGIFHFYDNQKKSKCFRASRICYSLTKGNVPPGLCVCHKCDNPRCVNPDHLFLDSPAGNAKDTSNKGRTSQSRFSNRQLKEMSDCKKQGMTHEQIAIKFKCEASWAGRLIKKYRSQNLSEKT